MRQSAKLTALLSSGSGAVANTSTQNFMTSKLLRVVRHNMYSTLCRPTRLRPLHNDSQQSWLNFLRIFITFVKVIGQSLLNKWLEQPVLLAHTAYSRGLSARHGICALSNTAFCSMFQKLTGPGPQCTSPQRLQRVNSEAETMGKIRMGVHNDGASHCVADIQIVKSDHACKGPALWQSRCPSLGMLSQYGCHK